MSIPATLTALAAAAVLALPAAATARGYEMVSPVDKNGIDVQNVLRMSADGNAVAWESNGAYAGTLGANAQSEYVGRRNPSGVWTTTPMFPKLTDSFRQEGFAFTGLWAMSDDMRYAAVGTKEGLNPADSDWNPTFNGPGGSFSTDVYRIGPPGTEPDWVSGSVDGPPPNTQFASDLRGFSDDGSTAFFLTAETLSNRVIPPVVSPYDSYRCPGSTAPCHLYRWRDGHAEIVDVDEHGDLLPGGGFLGRNVSSSSEDSGQKGELSDSAAVSPDGEMFAYGSSTTASQMYLHRSDGSVVLLSKSQATATLGQSSSTPSSFGGATRDFSVVYFTSGDQLTDDALAGGGLYRYDVATGQLSYSAPGTFGAVSDDGRYLYFVASSVLAAGATDGLSNLYVSGPDGVRFVASRPQSVARESLSADGKTLVFASDAQVTGYDNAGTLQIYVFHADTGSVRCVSCNSQQARSGAAALDLGNQGDSGAGGVKPAHSISADGSRIMFSTLEGLVAEDTNGQADVYEDIDGQLSLVSAGTSAYPSLPIGISADGHQVMFRTRSALSSKDRDGGLNDIYVLRDDIASEATQATTVDCAGDSCQGPSTQALSREAPATGDSSGSEGSGDIGSAPGKAFRLAAIGEVDRARAVSSGTLTVRLSILRAARLSLTAKAAIGGRSMVVAHAVRETEGKANLEIGLRLSAVARRRLAKAGRLKLTVTVSGGGRRSSVAVVLVKKRLSTRVSKKVAR